MNWIYFALAAALFAGGGTILTKLGVKNVHASYATAIRTAVILLFAFFILLGFGELWTLSDIPKTSIIFIILSGISTGLSWICFFLALKYGDATRASSIEKFSLVLTIFFGSIFLGEPFTESSLAGMLGIVMGIAFMVGIPRRAYSVDVRKEVPTENSDENESSLNGSDQMMKENAELEKYENKIQDYESLTIIEGEGKVISDKPIMKNFWFVMAILAAVFSGLTNILAKVGMEAVSPSAATFLRTVVVLAMSAILLVFQRKKINFAIEKKSLLFLILAGIVTGIGLVFYFAALKKGPVSLVAPIEKLSVVFASIFAWSVLKEKITMSSLAGLVLIILGTLTLLLP